MRAGFWRDGSTFAFAIGCSFAACASTSKSGAGASPGQRDASGKALPALPAKAPMNLEQARRYVLALVNRDR
ncbi:MAG TPA: hypothetical protein VGC79_18945, partial [Polyangiaceae bacterium]